MSFRKTSRNPKVQSLYDAQREHLRSINGGKLPCPFCGDQLKGRLILQDSKTMLVLENNFPYEDYDGRKVAKHNMVLPRRHIATMQEFTSEEVSEYWQIVSQASLDGYAIMTRSAKDEMRSNPHHLHTHLFLYRQD